jgi:DNA-binding transcriptional ArsR family regulator
MPSTTLIPNEDALQTGRVFELAAQLFTLLGTPMRLRILNALCEGERSVTQMLHTIDTTQPNLSQHLSVMYRSGLLAKRKEGTQVIYRVQSDKALTLCRSVCSHIAMEMDDAPQMPASERLLAQV